MKRYIRMIRLACTLAILLCAVLLLAQCTFARDARGDTSARVTLPAPYFTALFDTSVHGLDEATFAQTHGFLSCAVQADGEVTLELPADSADEMQDALGDALLEKTQHVRTLPEIVDVTVDESGEHIAITLAAGEPRVPDTIVQPLALLASAKQWFCGERDPHVNFTVESAQHETLDEFVLYGADLLAEPAV